MPNSHGDESPVTWGRFTATIDALAARITGLEDQNERQFTRIEGAERAAATAEENRRTLAAQVTGLTAHDETRRQRTWSLTTTILASAVLPVLVSLILVWLHVKVFH
jgi:hypothetical protein